MFGIVSISDTRLALHLALGRCKRRRGDREIIRSLDRRERSIKRTKRLRRCRYRAISPRDDTRELTRGITSRGRRGRLVILPTIYRQRQQQQHDVKEKGDASPSNQCLSDPLASVGESYPPSSPFRLVHSLLIEIT